MRQQLYFRFVCGMLALFAAGPLAAQSDAGTDWMRQADDPRRLGQQLLKEGNLEQAKEVLERAEVQYPGDTNVLRGLAEVYYRLGKERFDAGSSVEGVYFYERALQKDRMFPLTWVGLGESRYAEGDLDGAVEALAQAETLNAQGARELMARVRTTRAYRGVDLGRLKEADEDVSEALQRLPDDPEAKLVLGRLRHAQERSEEALAPLREAARDSRFFAEATLYLALAQEALEAWEKAIAEADRLAAVSENKQRVDAIRARSYYNWALDAYDASQWAAAERRFLQARDYAQEWDDPVFGAGLARLQMGQGEESVALLEPLYERKPDYDGLAGALASAKHVVGKSLIKAGRFATAAETLNQAFKLDPTQTSILLALGTAEEGRGNYEAALEAYLKAVRTGVGGLQPRYEAMRVLEEHLKRPAEALVHAEAILRRKTDDADAKTRAVRLTKQLGLDAFSRKNYEDAITLLTRHAELVKPDAEAAYALAFSLHQELRYKNAYAWIDSLYKAASGNRAYADLQFDVLVGLGDETTLLRRWSQAKDYYARALEIQPQRQLIRFRYAYALLELRDYPAATEQFRQVWSRATPLQPRAARPLARALTGWGDALLETEPVRTVALAGEAIERDSEYPDAYFTRSRGYEKQDNLDKALPDAEDYYERRPEDLDGEAWLVSLLRRGLDEAFADARYPIAEARAARLLELRIDDHDGVYWYARAVYAQDRWLEAEPYFSKAAADGPHRADAYVYLARGTYGAGEYEKSARYYLAARRLNPDAAPAGEQIQTFQAAATAAENEGRYQDVATYYNYAFLLAPDNAAIAYRYGRALVKIDKAADAIPHLRRAHGLWPERRDVALDYAQALTSTRNPDLAVEVLLPWEDPQQAGYQDIRLLVGRAYFQAARQYKQDGDLETAAARAEEAASRLDPEPEPWYLFGTLHYDLGNIDMALAALMHLHGLSPEYKELPLYLANSHARKGFDALTARDVDAALAEFLQSIEFRETVEALYGRLLVAEAQRQPQTIVDLAKRIETLEPGYRDILARRVAATRILGEQAYKDKNFKKAEDYFEDMISIKSDAYEAYYYLGAVAYQDDKMRRAVKHLETAADNVGLDYRNLRAMLTFAYNGQAEEYMDSGKFDNAMEYIDKSLELNERQPQVLIWKGTVYAQQERWSRARGSYEQVINMHGVPQKWQDEARELLQKLPQ